MTIVMTPDKEPFFAATYVPRQDSYGRIGLLTLIPRISDFWTKERSSLADQAGRVRAALQRTFHKVAPIALDASVLHAAYNQLTQQYDEAWGGFGGAPKFPAAHNLIFLLRYYAITEDAQALAMVEQTLSAMRRGGIYDQIGCGFHRYATDQKWQVPHFEKMLYDQAMLLLAYTQAFQVTGNIDYRDTAGEIIRYMQRDLRHDQGGFYAAEDADSEGEEGRFYTWTWQELERILNSEEVALAHGAWRLEQGVLQSRTPDDSPALRALRQKLLHHRDQRPRPARDSKILTDWNGLAIAALARAGRVFGRADCLEMAEQASRFIMQYLRRKDQGLFHRFARGQAAVPGFLDDYAFLVFGFLEMFAATFQGRFLLEGKRLMDRALQDFWSQKRQRFFHTSHSSENLLFRSMDSYDSAMPSGTSVAYGNLAYLSHLFADPTYRRVLSGLERAMAQEVMAQPRAYTAFLGHLAWRQAQPREVVLAGDDSLPGCHAALQELKRVFVPNTVLLFKDTKEDDAVLQDLLPYLANYPATNGPAIYVCRDFACQMPVGRVDQALELLTETVSVNRKKDVIST